MICQGAGDQQCQFVRVQITQPAYLAPGAKLSSRRLTAGSAKGRSRVSMPVHIGLWGLCQNRLAWLICTP